MTAVIYNTKYLHLNSEQKNIGSSTSTKHSYTPVSGISFNGAKTVFLRKFICDGNYENISAGSNQISVEHNRNSAISYQIPIGSYSVKGFANALMIGLNTIATANGSVAIFSYSFNDLNQIMISNDSVEPFKIIFDDLTTTIPRKYLGMTNTATYATSNFQGILTSAKQINVEPWSDFHLLFNGTTADITTNFYKSVAVPKNGLVEHDIAHITLPAVDRGKYLTQHDYKIEDSMILTTSASTLSTIPSIFTVEFLSASSTVMNIENIYYDIVLAFIF